MYILSMAIGYFGLRYIELSISSPISNFSGAVSTLLTFFLLGGTMDGIQFGAVVIISIGIFLLSFFEKQEFNRELKAEGQKIEKKYKIRAVAIIFPILHCIIDGLAPFLDGYYLEFNQLMSEDQVNVSYELASFFYCLLNVGDTFF